MLLDVGTAAECEKIVHQLVAQVKQASRNNDDDDDDDDDDEGDVEETQKPYDIIQGTSIAIGSRPSGKPPLCWKNFDFVINCTQTHYQANTNNPHYLQLPIAEGKKGQQKLLDCIPDALEFVKKPLSAHNRILIHCAKGQDRSIGIALAILVRYFDTDMNFVPKGVSSGKFQLW